MDIINTVTWQTLDINIRKAKQLRGGNIAIQVESKIDLTKLQGSIK